jgi:tetratricopeptide (TPR) repeat protein
LTLELNRLQVSLSGRYRVERRIGGGAMGTVYRAEDLKHHRKVAIKVLRPEYATILGPKRFLREIEITAQFHHPHILQLYDSGDADGLLYYVMPYVEGESLRIRVQREKRLSVEEGLRLGAEVADALEYAHVRGVIHRDIKPENILLEAGLPLLADFGIARASHGEGQDRLTATGMTPGTPDYMSPEQVAGLDDIDGRSDVYSLGCVLYELLTGQPPFAGEDARKVLHQHLHSEPRRLTQLRPEIPAPVAAVIHRSLAKERSERYATAGEFARALAAPEAAQTAQPWRRHTWIGLALAAVVALVVLVALLLPGEGRQLNQRRVLVAALENRTDDPSLDAVGRLASDWITRGLLEVEVIEVVPPEAITWGGSATTRELGEATASGTVVTGAFYRFGDSLQFEASVTDAQRERVLLSVEPVRGTADEPLGAVEELRRRVVAALASTLDGRIADYQSPSQTPPPLRAYRAFAEGQDIYNQAFDHGRGAEREEALGLFLEAFEIDTTFTAALIMASISADVLGDTALADSLYRLADQRRAGLTRFAEARLDLHIAAFAGDRMGALEAARRMPETPLDNAMQALWTNRPQEALDVLEDASEWYVPALRTRGWDGIVQISWDMLTAAHHMLGDHRRELRAAREASDEYPAYLGALRQEVQALAALGRVAEVQERLQRALEYPPQPDWTAGGVMLTASAELRAHGHRDASLRSAERAVAWHRSRPAEEAAGRRHRFMLGNAHYLAEQWEDAEDVFGGLAEEFPRDPNYRGFLAVLAARRGDREEALRLSSGLAQLASRFDFGREPYWQACVASLLGEPERAMVLLREAYAAGRLVTLALHRDVDLEPLWDYQAFREFVRPKED